ncbi:NADH dehydrogenase FAD-containing subunit [bacterium]|nr:NADH dehydrogenase FAD-containing subunit [bacterium]
MSAALVIMPLAAGCAAFVARWRWLRQAILLAVTGAHAVLTACCWFTRREAAPGAWLALDAPGLLFLSITSLLALLAAVYSIGYLRRERESGHEDFEEGFVFANQPEAVFTGCLLVFLGTMSLVCVSRHFGVLWVAIEATTLASAPLIHFHRHHRSLEAAWKYLLICSVGIALALLGTYFLSVAVAGPDGAAPQLSVAVGAWAGKSAQGAWLRAAFICMLVGYGTKMGLAPMHTWLPDAHSEAPSLVSALLSGALLNCAFLALLRMSGVCGALGEGAFCGRLLAGFGLLSMGVAAVFIVAQRDFKRLLAYSSVEHMGILAFGAGIGLLAAGTGGAGGALLHAANHSTVKALLFLVAGNVIAAYKTKDIGSVRGMLRVQPASGVLWLAGIIAITGMPPFGVFVGKFMILKAAFDARLGWCAAVALGIMAVIFLCMTRAAAGMVFGDAPAGMARERELRATIVPPMALCALALVLGVCVPGALQQLIAAAVAALGGRP